jgi:hypothetical protein
LCFIVLEREKESHYKAYLSYGGQNMRVGTTKGRFKNRTTNKGPDPKKPNPGTLDIRVLQLDPGPVAFWRWPNTYCRKS